VKLIAGLGNPGPRYRGTLHNVGFAIVDELARRRAAVFESAPADAVMARVRDPVVPLLLVKPLTMMNRSGDAVGALLRYFRIDPVDLLVVVDDVNLPVGRIRARPRGSAGGHNGLKSIIAAIGTGEFARLRVGVGRGDPRRDLADHVLARPAPDEAATLERAASEAADAVELFAREGIEAVMNRYNRAPDAPDAPGGSTPAETND
jgi:PTH1 family peptidyl-tRNA hydrolase